MDVLANLPLEWRALLQLLLSALLGFCIGFERKLRFKGAGIRTHTIVCMGSAMMMLVSLYAFGEGGDPARVAAQIVSGIGFLGAGIIFYKRQEVRGLTTAAGIWTTAAIGMACGGGLYILAAGATVLLIAVQCIFHIDCRLFRSKRFYYLRVEFSRVEDAPLRVKGIFGVKHFNRLVIRREGEGLRYSAVISTDREFSSLDLDRILQENPFIFYVERCDEE